MAAKITTILMSQSKWGRLTPLNYVRDHSFPSGQRKAIWRFQCDCGAEPEIIAYSVTNGQTQSCGCLSRETKATATRSHGATRKGGSHDLAYRSWRNMLTRGRNPNINNADRYVLRGVTVHADWQPGGDGMGYQRFLAHVGPRPSPAHSLDRIDNEKGYEPGNVRWVLQRDQMNNTSRTRYVFYQGERLPLTVAAEMSGVKPGVIRDRMKLGWPPEKLFDPRARAEFGRGPCSRPGVKPRT
jgi:hypothetical protein